MAHLHSNTKAHEFTPGTNSLLYESSVTAKSVPSGIAVESHPNGPINFRFFHIHVWFELRSTSQTSSGGIVLSVRGLVDVTVTPPHVDLQIKHGTPTSSLVQLDKPGIHCQQVWHWNVHIHCTMFYLKEKVLVCIYSHSHTLYPLCRHLPIQVGGPPIGTTWHSAMHHKAKSAAVVFFLWKLECRPLVSCWSSLGIFFVEISTAHV